LLKELYDTNFRSIFFGLETASEDLMKTLRKGETVKECRKAVKMAKEIGFFIEATFLFGIPGESHKDRMNCFMMAKELGIDRVRFNNITPYPGTALYEIAKQQGRLHVKGNYENFNSVSVFIENPFSKIPLSYVPPGSTEAEIRYDVLACFSLFLWHRVLRFRGNVKTESAFKWFKPTDTFVMKMKRVIALGTAVAILCVKFADLSVALLTRRTALSFSELSRLLKTTRVSEKVETL